MIITPSALTALFTAFRREFQQAQAGTPTDWQKVATQVPSTSTSNTYGWLGQFPQFREWVGDRVIKDMAAHGYAITNKTWESTVGVDRDDIEDDNIGIYTPLFAEMGRAASAHPDELVFPLLKAGTATLCYDGQNFFDTDHPVYPNTDGTGVAVSVSNVDVDTVARPNNPTWYLMDVSRAIKPIIFQKRREYALQAMTKVDDEAVFTSKTYRYGVDARVNVGLGFWQFAYASNQPLDADHYGAAVAAMKTFKADGNRPLGIRPNLLVVPPSLEAGGRKLLVKDENGGNEWAGSAELLVSSWLG
jgi:phage major head subunit gpT-like protein